MQSFSPSKAIPPNGSKNLRPRLLGLDLLRGLAMLAVILLHADEWSGIETLPDSWPAWIEFANFAVPFFLAASFYLSIGKLISHPEKPFPLSVRLNRLMMPYVAWSAIYLAYKIVRYGLLGKIALLQSLASDPLLIMFVGGAGFHLYFLPLLMTGTALLKPLSGKPLSLLKGMAAPFMFGLSVLLYNALLQGGNMVETSLGVAFAGWFAPPTTNNVILRPLLVYLAWSIRCLPYITFAIVLYPLVQKRPNFYRNWGAFVGLAIAFIGVNLYGSQWISPGLLEVLRGYSGVLFAIALSYCLKPHLIIANLGVCSFGIYLIHLLFLEIFQTIWIRLSPETAKAPSLTLLFGIILLTFALSWGLTHWLMQRRSAAKWLFGT